MFWNKLLFIIFFLYDFMCVTNKWIIIWIVCQMKKKIPELNFFFLFSGFIWIKLLEFIFHFISGHNHVTMCLWVDDPPTPPPIWNNESNVWRRVMDSIIENSIVHWVYYYFLPPGIQIMGHNHGHKLLRKISIRASLILLFL